MSAPPGAGKHRPQSTPVRELTTGAPNPRPSSSLPKRGGDPLNLSRGRPTSAAPPIPPPPPPANPQRNASPSPSPSSPSAQQDRHRKNRGDDVDGPAETRDGVATYPGEEGSPGSVFIGSRTREPARDDTPTSQQEAPAGVPDLELPLHEHNGKDTGRRPTPPMSLTAQAEEDASTATTTPQNLRGTSNQSPLYTQRSGRTPLERPERPALSAHRSEYSSPPLQYDDSEDGGEREKVVDAREQQPMLAAAHSQTSPAPAHTAAPATVTDGSSSYQTGSSEDTSSQWTGEEGGRRVVHVKENETVASRSEVLNEKGERCEVERLVPINFRSTHPADQFFVHFIENPNNLHGLTKEDRLRRQLGQTKVDITVQPRNEEDMMLEQFAEFTDDDSFFSSGSSVISNDPQRMEGKTRVEKGYNDDDFDNDDNDRRYPPRSHAVSSVKETLLLKSYRNGYGGQEDWVNKEIDVHWLYQIHHRAICLKYSSFFVFPAHWTPRVVVYNLLHHWVMELFLLFTILAYAIFQACWARNPPPFLGPVFSKPDYMLFADVFFTVLLAVEVLLRLFACGVVLHPRSFFRSPWHWLDLAVLILMCMTCSNWRDMWNYTAWRLIRIIKCCRYFPAPVRLKILAKSFLRSTARLISVTLYMIFFIFFFALLGLHLFRGELESRCANDISAEATTQLCNPRATGKHWFYWGHRCDEGYTCVRASFNNPHFGFRTYDDIGHALLSTFQIMTFQGWTSLLTETNDAMNTLAFLYYFFVILVCSWIIPSLFIGVFMERLLVVRRRFLFKQVSTFDAILSEQRHRQNAAVKLHAYVTRNEDGEVSHYPNYDHDVLEDKVNKGLHVPLSETKWTDEKRVQLHLSLTRQAELAALDKEGMQAVMQQRQDGYEDRLAEAEERRRKDAEIAAAGGLVRHFELGGEVGDVQHHPDSCAIGEMSGNPKDFAHRQRDAIAPYTFLAGYKEKEDQADKQLAATVKLNSARATSTSFRMGSPSAGGAAAVRPGGLQGTVEEVDQKVLYTREVPGVIPSQHLDDPSSTSDGGSLLKEYMGADELELVVHDPEGGDFDYAPKVGKRWSIIRNIVHMAAEGYPRIVTQYLWEYMWMRQKYGLRPLHYTNRFEDDVLQLLRRRRLEEIRDTEARNRRLGRYAAEDCNSNAGDSEDLTQQEETAIFNNPMQMAEKISENAPPTVLNIITYVLIFVNAVFNATRFMNMPHYWADALFYIGVVFSVLFFLELMLHVVALGPSAFVFHGFYPLELIFVVLSFFQLGFDRSNAITVFNWIRFLRLARISPFKPMQQSARVLLIAFPDLLFGLFFFSMYMFMWVLIGMSLFGSHFAALVPADYYTRGNFNNFSYALYAVAQAFSINRDQWLYLSWSGMRAHGGYTIIYFICAVLVAFIFRFFFIAVCVAAWQAYSERSADVVIEKLNNALELQTLMKRRNQYRRRPWFDFSVWRSFKHIHGGFQRRHIAPDDVYHLNEDMRRQLRAAESRSRHYKQLYEKASPQELAEASGYGAEKEVKYINVGGRLHRQYAPEGEPQPPATLSYLSQGQVEDEDVDASGRRTSPTSPREDGADAKKKPVVVTAVRAVSCEGQLLSQKCMDYCRMCDFNAPREHAEVEDPNRFRHLYGDNGEELLIANPIHADRHSLSPAMPWKNGGGLARTTPRGPSVSLQDHNNIRGTSVFSSRFAELYPNAPAVSAQFYTLLRNPEHVEEEEEGEEEEQGGNASGRRRQEARRSQRPQQHMPFRGETSLHPLHLLLPGPQIKPYYKPVDGFQRVLDRCVECNAYKQVPLPHAKGVAGRDADDLHNEHCHMAAVRNARQTVLYALLGYVEAQMEHDVAPTRECVEIVLGQAWSCGMLLFETLENVYDETIAPEQRTWDPLLQALKLQKWLTGLQVGEEQVGRAGLAYMLAHHATHDQEVTIRRHNAPFKAAENPNSFWNNDKSFFLLAPENVFRAAIAKFVHTLLFESIVLFIIFLAAVCLAIYTPGQDNKDMGGTYNSNKYKILHGFDDAFTILFVIEMLLRWIADGVILPAGKAYFWFLWNIFDFFIVIISLVSWFDGDVHLRYLKVFRLFRLVGHMRFCVWANICVLANGLWTSIPTLANVCLIMLGNYVIWTIIFCSMFFEKMGKCSDPSFTVKTACESQGFEWVDAFDRTFSNFYKSLLTTFEISTGAEWMDVMYNAVDSWSTYLPPRTNRHPYLGLVFIAYYYIAHFVLFALLSSAIIHWYIRNRCAMVGVEETASPQLARWQRLRSMVSIFAPRIKLLPMSFSFSRFLHRVVTHWIFELVMALIILANALVMCFEWSGMPRSQKDILDVFQYIFLACFTIEIIMRFMAHGLRAFTRGAFCWDVLVTILSFIQIILNTTDDHFMPFDVNVLRLLRVGRLLNVFCFFETPRNYATVLHVAVTSAVWDLVAVGLFYALSILVFAVAGLHMLGYIVPYGGYISMPYNNFYTFVNSIIMVFRLSTLENWATMLRGSLDRGDYCPNGRNCGPTNWAPVYYIALLLCCFVLVSSLFMAVVLYHYMTMSRMMRDIGRWNDLFSLREAWTLEDPNATGFLPVERLPILLEKLRAPLGIANRFNRVELLRLLRAYHIPVSKSGEVRYDDVLLAVARRVIAMAVAEKEIGSSRKRDSYAKSWRRVELEYGVFDEERLQEEINQIQQGYYHLPTEAAMELNRFKPQKPTNKLYSTSPYSAEDYFAVSYIQAAYRRDKATRHAIVERAHLWRRSRQACDLAHRSYSQYGFSRYALSGPDPALEGQARGFEMGNVSLRETPRTNPGTARESPGRVYAQTAPTPNQHSRRNSAKPTAPSMPARRPLHPRQDDSHPLPPRAPHAVEEPLEGEEYPVLPRLYRSAIQTTSKTFGPEAEGAIKRGERRSDKLAKDAAAAAAAARRSSSGNLRHPSAFSSRSGMSGSSAHEAGGRPGTSGSSCSFDDSTSVSRTSSQAQRYSGYQPPLGTDLEALREEELRRRAKYYGS